MPETVYSFDVTNTFPDGKVNTVTLSTEIAKSSIETAIARIDTIGGSITDSVLTGGTIDIVFKNSLSTQDETTLNSTLIPAHDNSPTPVTTQRFTEDGKAVTEHHPESDGYDMCDRDFKINTCLVDPKANLTVGGADSDGDVLYTSTIRGVLGNLYTVEHIDTASGGLTVSVTGFDVVVDFGGAAPTGTQVKDAVNADSDAAKLVLASTPGTGASAAGLLAQSNLVGGVNNSIEDLKINPSTVQEKEWYECSQVGIYDSSGVLLETQGEADSDGVWTVVEYLARNQSDLTQPVSYEIRDGNVIVDAGILTNLYSHRAYAIGAPDIPANLGGQVAFFDGYLGVLAGKKLEATSPTAKTMDPNGAGGVAGAVLRVFFKHPVGAKNSHILRIVTYRQSGTF